MAPREKHLSRNWIIVGGATLFVGAAMCAGQFGDRYGMNSMPYAEVQALASDLPKAQKMASQGNIELLGGQAVQGKAVSLRGEITDANCFLPRHEHAYDHAFCAKLCAATGSPLVFIPDQSGQIYVVLTQTNAVRIPDGILDQIGIPGISVKGRLVESHGIAGLAVESIVQ